MRREPRIGNVALLHGGWRRWTVQTMSFVFTSRAMQRFGGAAGSCGAVRWMWRRLNSVTLPIGFCVFLLFGGAITTGQCDIFLQKSGRELSVSLGKQ